MVSKKILTVSAASKFDLIADTYDNTPQEYFAQWDGKILMDVLRDTADKRILDIGCGTGRLLAKLNTMSRESVGIDISPLMAEKAREKGLTVFCSDILNFNTDESFDVVLSVLTFNYIREKSEAFKRVYSLLGPEGRFILVSDLQKEDTPVAKEEEVIQAEYYPLSKDEYKKLFEGSGFSVNIVLDLYWSEDFRNDAQTEIIGFLIEGVK
jgi:SAM-dependent methyltransferase